MLCADYWISRLEKPDQLLLSAEAVSRQNLLIQNPSASEAAGCACGICCSESSLFYRPVREPQTEPEDPYSDENRFSGVLVNEPVEILETTDNELWLRVRSPRGSGWIPAEAVARCRSRTEWLEAQETGDSPLIVTGRRLFLQTERSRPEKEPASYRMGTCFRLIPAMQAPRTIDNRFYFDNYVIRVPLRDTDGFLNWVYRLIPVSEDVHVGWLPLTPRNLLQQIFKIQGDVYGWGDMYRSCDCSSYAMAVYRCFGLFLPRDSSRQAQMPVFSVNLQGQSSREKAAVLTRALPGSLLWFPGHIVLYLGHEKENFYGISATGSCLPCRGEEPVSAGTVFLCELNSMCRKNGRSWLSEFQKLLEPQKPPQ